MIPRNLFPRGERPSNLITLPECCDCNQGASKDEEYFLVAILAQGTLRNPAAQRRLDEMRHSPRNRTKLARRFLRDLERLAAPVAGVAGRFPLEVPRANRVLRRIVRGLYRHEFEVELPPDHPMAISIEPPAESMRMELFQFVALQQERVYGDRVFSYRVSRSRDDARSAWLLTFYDAFQAFVVEPNGPTS